MSHVGSLFLLSESLLDLLLSRSNGLSMGLPAPPSILASLLRRGSRIVRGSLLSGKELCSIGKGGSLEKPHGSLCSSLRSRFCRGSRDSLTSTWSLESLNSLGSLSISLESLYPAALPSLGSLPLLSAESLDSVLSLCARCLRGSRDTEGLTAASVAGSRDDKGLAASVAGSRDDKGLAAALIAGFNPLGLSAKASLLGCRGVESGLLFSLVLGVAPLDNNL